MVEKRKTTHVENPGRRDFLKAAPAASLGIITAAMADDFPACGGAATPIKAGILHSLSGTMSVSETPLQDAEVMAIEEINAAGGVLGKKIETIIEDPASSLDRFEDRSEKLLSQDKVCSVFGCWTSASRKAVLPIFEKYNGLLWYPVEYEGNECSRNVIYSGSTPHQQIIPAVEWLLESGRRKFYLLGSDYVFPRTANRIVKSHLAREGGRVVGEEYQPLGWRDFGETVKRIRAAKPDVVLSTINGDSNRAFYRHYTEAGITAKDIPIMATSMGEAEVRAIGALSTLGHYAAAAYFQSLDTPDNRTFVQRFKDRYGDMRVTDDPIEAAYFQVHLWAQAVTKAGSVEVDAIRQAAAGQEFAAPEGRIHIDTVNRHTWKMLRIGEVEESGQFKILYSSSQPLPPNPWSSELEPALACDWATGKTVAAPPGRPSENEDEKQAGNK